MTRLLMFSLILVWIPFVATGQTRCNACYYQNFVEGTIYLLNGESRDGRLDFLPGTVEGPDRYDRLEQGINLTTLIYPPADAGTVLFLRSGATKPERLDVEQLRGFVTEKDSFFVAENLMVSGRVVLEKDYVRVFKDEPISTYARMVYNYNAISYLAGDPCIVRFLFGIQGRPRDLIDLKNADFELRKRYLSIFIQNYRELYDELQRDRKWRKNTNMYVRRYNAWADEQE